MAGIARVHGSAYAQAFYGLQPAVVLVSKSNAFTADTGGGAAGEIVEGGYTGAVRALETVASIVWLGDRHSGSDYFSAVVDMTSFNTGPGATTSGDYGALADALAANCGGSGSDYTITVSEKLEGDGTFSFA